MGRLTVTFSHFRSQKVANVGSVVGRRTIVLHLAGYTIEREEASRQLPGALANKTDGKVHLRSWNNQGLNRRYPAVAKAPATLPDKAVIDGEVVTPPAGLQHPAELIERSDLPLRV